MGREKIFLVKHNARTRVITLSKMFFIRINFKIRIIVLSLLLTAY